MCKQLNGLLLKSLKPKQSTKKIKGKKRGQAKILHFVLGRAEILISLLGQTKISNIILCLAEIATIWARPGAKITSPCRPLLWHDHKIEFPISFSFSLRG